MKRRAIGIWLLAGVCLGFVCGCPVTTTLPTKAEIKEESLPGGEGKFYLYVPSTYDKRRPYPVVIACHGTNPWDDAWAQIREWAQFAEEHEIIVAAPVLGGTHGDIVPSVTGQIEKEQADERTILDLVSRLKAQYNVSEERVFLTGWSAGSFAVLYTGLRNPDVFRALAIRQGNFKADYIAVEPTRMDRWQPIFIYYGNTDLLRPESLECITWLRDKNMFVEQLEVPGSHKRLDVALSWNFFKKIAKERPWIRLRTAKVDVKNRRVVKFWCEAKPAYSRIVWVFGDGEQSEEEAPTHEYAQPGTYDVSAKVSLRGAKTYTRKVTVRVGPPGTAAPSGTPSEGLAPPG